MKRGWIIAIVVIFVLLVAVAATTFIFYNKSSGGSLDFGNIDYSRGTVDLDFEGGANTIKKVETNPFRYGEQNG
jgi:flagellar basal body-associated protein FliL